MASGVADTLRQRQQRQTGEAQGGGRAARLSCLATVGWEQQTLNRSKLPGRWGRLTGAVQFHRRQTELLGDVGVFDGQGFLHLKCVCVGESTVSVNLKLLRVGRTNLRIGCLRKLLLHN